MIKQGANNGPAPDGGYAVPECFKSVVVPAALSVFHILDNLEPTVITRTHTQKERNSKMNCSSK